MNPEEDKTKDIIEYLDRIQDNNVNFADYMFLRRVSLAWNDCAAGKQLSKINVPCAMRIAVPGWIADEQDSNFLMNLNTIIKEGKLKYQTPYLDCMSFLEMAHLYYYFVAFEMPFNNGIV
jgi:hypothetical protein